MKDMMHHTNITCGMCGHTFDPAGQEVCQQCPLKKGCSLVCCPNCGYEMVDLQRSKFTLWLSQFFQPQGGPRQLPGLTLADIKPGEQARVAGFSDHIPSVRRAHLQAYGLVPGRELRVMQHNPVTIIQVEQIELALENGLAREVLVELGA